MSEDIVETLRSRGRVVAGKEAADEIERLRAEVSKLKEVTAEAYQVVGALADHCGAWNHPDVERARDYLAFEDKRAEPLTPWPKTPLPETGGEAERLRARVAELEGEKAVLETHLASSAGLLLAYDALLDEAGRAPAPKELLAASKRASAEVYASGYRDALEAAATAMHPMLRSMLSRGEAAASIRALPIPSYPGAAK